MVEIWTPKETLEYLLELERTLSSGQEPLQIIRAAEDATRRLSEDQRRDLTTVLTMDAPLAVVRDEVLRAYRRYLVEARPSLEQEIEQERQDDLRRLSEYYRELQGRVSATRLSEIVLLACAIVDEGRSVAIRDARALPKRQAKELIAAIMKEFLVASLPA